MSMTGNLARISQRQYDDLHRNPTGITTLLSTEAPVQTRPPAPQSVFGRVWTFIQPVRPPGLDNRLGEEDRLNLDKSWHVLHFLLTGAGWEGVFPAGFLVSAGRSVGIVDVGYGPARSFDTAEVSELATFLRNLDEHHLRSRFNPRNLEDEDIYPGGWSHSQDIDQEWHYIRGTYLRMNTFILEAAARQKALLVYIN
jgi:hypothetical protein